MPAVAGDRLDRDAAHIPARGSPRARRRSDARAAARAASAARTGAGASSGGTGLRGHRAVRLADSADCPTRPQPGGRRQRPLPSMTCWRTSSFQLVRAQQPVALGRDPHVGLGSVPVADQSRLAQHRDHRAVLGLEPQRALSAGGRALAAAPGSHGTPTPRPSRPASRSPTDRTAGSRPWASSGSGTRSKNTRSWLLSGRSESFDGSDRRRPASSPRSRTRRCRSCPSARATETR